jgi:hypothetical protein
MARYGGSIIIHGMRRYARACGTGCDASCASTRCERKTHDSLVVSNQKYVASSKISVDKKISRSQRTLSPLPRR